MRWPSPTVPTARLSATYTDEATCYALIDLAQTDRQAFIGPPRPSSIAPRGFTLCADPRAAGGGDLNPPTETVVITSVFNSVKRDAANFEACFGEI